MRSAMSAMILPSPRRGFPSLRRPELALADRYATATLAGVSRRKRGQLRLPMERLVSQPRKRLRILRTIVGTKEGD